MLNNNRDFFKSQGTKRPADQAGLSVTCPQCGAGIAFDQGRSVRVCPFCDSAIAVQQLPPVARWLIKPVLSHSECFRLLSAWLWENYHGVATCPEIMAQEWIPWRHAVEGPARTAMTSRAHLADAGKYPELRDLKLPPGEHIPFSEDAARGFALPDQPQQLEPGERMIYMPAYIASFRIGQRAERAVIEAATGKVRGPIQKSGDAQLRRWIAFGVAALALAVEAMVIRNIVARLVVLGVTYAGLELALGLVWEGLLWRR